MYKNSSLGFCNIRYSLYIAVAEPLVLPCTRNQPNVNHIITTTKAKLDKIALHMTLCIKYTVEELRILPKKFKYKFKGWNSKLKLYRKVTLL